MEFAIRRTPCVMTHCLMQFPTRVQSEIADLASQQWLLLTEGVRAMGDAGPDACLLGLIMPICMSIPGLIMAPIGMSIPEPICMPGVMSCMIRAVHGKGQLSCGIILWYWKLSPNPQAKHWLPERELGPLCMASICMATGVHILVLNEMPMGKLMLTAAITRHDCRTKPENPTINQLVCISRLTMLELGAESHVQPGIIVRYFCILSISSVCDVTIDCEVFSS